MPFTRHVTFRTVAAAALLTLLAACATTTGESGPSSEARAERLLRQGNPAEAARMYEDLANSNPPPARDQFALSAARAWLDANRADDAQRALAIASVQLPAAQRFDRDLLQIEVTAARGQYETAWQQVSQMPEPSRAQDASRLFYLRQQVALRAGEPVAAVRAGVARERVAADDGGRTRVRRDLLIDLRAAIERGARINPAATNVALERGWLELGQIAADAGRSPLSARAMIERWQQRFPGHPASTIVESEILDPAARPDAGGSRNARVTGPVALLLPVSHASPALRSAAALIRDGFQAAAGRLPDAGLGNVRIYDTAAMSVATAMRTAADEGASFIVGPLTREEAQAAAASRVGDIPVLLLNTVSGSAGNGVWQYALAPEDEARQIARQIAGAGGRNAVVLAPGGDWGTRVAAAFTDEFRHAGGSVLTEGIYDLSRNNMEATVVRALGFDASRQRRDRVQSAVGARVEFEVRPNPGIDAIFAAGFEPLAMRQIRPYLRQYNADGIPTYMTSEGLAAERSANRDLEGMRLLDMPWNLDTVGNAYDVRLATENLWRGAGDSRQARLFAFGYDAAVLTAGLRRGSVAWPLDGVTGRLNLAPGGRIERQLNWARVQDGAVLPSDPQR